MRAARRQRRVEVNRRAEARRHGADERGPLRDVAARGPIGEDQRQPSREHRAEEGDALVKEVLSVERDLGAELIDGPDDALGDEKQGDLQDRGAGWIDPMMAGRRAHLFIAEWIAGEMELIVQIEVAVEDQRQGHEVHVMTVAAVEDRMVAAVAEGLLVGGRVPEIGEERRRGGGRRPARAGAGAGAGSTLDGQAVERRYGEAARRDGGLDVGEEVVHDRARVALLQSDLDRVVRALGLRAAEGEETQAQPALEDGLLDRLVAAALTELDDDPLAERLVTALLADDLADDALVRRVGAALVFLELPEAAAIVEELRHGELEP